MPMGKVVSIDRARLLRRNAGRAGPYAGAEPEDGGEDGDGLFPSEYQGLCDLFDLAREMGLVLRMTIQPYAEGFLFRAFAARDPSYTLFEIQKIRNGRMFEYHGRIRHQLVVVSFNFYPFIDQMRGGVMGLVDILGPRPPQR
jgi:hypothetical protein